MKKESKTLKVCKQNKLNEGNFSGFELNDYRVYLLLISKFKYIETEEGRPQISCREYLLTAKEFSKMFDIDLSNCYEVLKNSCKKLMKTSILLNKMELGKIREINICSSAIYCEKEGRISIKFTDDIMPHLSNVISSFTLYNLKEVSNFGSLYTIRLYETLMQFKNTGWVIKSIEELRSILGVPEGKLTLYANLKAKTIVHATNEINDTYKDLNLTFKEIKEGRKVSDIRLDFNTKKRK